MPHVVATSVLILAVSAVSASAADIRINLNGEPLTSDRTRMDAEETIYIPLVGSMEFIDLAVNRVF